MPVHTRRLSAFKAFDYESGRRASRLCHVCQPRHVRRRPGDGPKGNASLAPALWKLRRGATEHNVRQPERRWVRTQNERNIRYVSTDVDLAGTRELDRAP